MGGGEDGVGAGVDGFADAEPGEEEEGEYELWKDVEAAGVDGFADAEPGEEEGVSEGGLLMRFIASLACCLLRISMGLEVMSSCSKGAAKVFMATWF